MNDGQQGKRLSIRRRAFLGFLGAGTITGLLAACQAPAAPTAAPAAKPTTAPVAQPTTAAAAPTSAPAAQAPAAQPTAASAAVKKGGTLTIGTSQDVLTFDLPNYRSTQDMLVGGIAYEGLLTYDKDMKLQGVLAESWKQVDDTTYQFELRKGVKFHDGTPFNADAVKSFFTRAITGVKSNRFYDMTESITTQGDSTVVFKLKRAFAPFIGNISYPTGLVQSPASIQQFGEDIGRHAVGTGPFKLAEWVANERITFERNADYWGTPAPLDRVVVRYIQDESTRMAALESGEVDVVQNPPPQDAGSLKSSNTLQPISGPYAQSFWLAMTASHPPLNDVRVRRAIAMAVDGNALRAITEGIARPATGFMPPEVMPSSTTPVKGDVAQAKQLLSEAGFPNGFSVELWSPNGTYLRDKEIAQALQPMLKTIGVDAQVKVMDYAAYSDALRRHEGQLFVLGWAHTTSPDNFYRAVYLSTSGSNWSNVTDPKVDEMIEKAVGQTSLPAAVQVWQTLDQYLVDQAVGVPITFSTQLYGAKKSVNGFAPTPLGYLNAIGQVSIS